METERERICHYSFRFRLYCSRPKFGNSDPSAERDNASNLMTSKMEERFVHVVPGELLSCIIKFITVIIYIFLFECSYPLYLFLHEYQINQIKIKNKTNNFSNRY